MKEGFEEWGFTGGFGVFHFKKDVLEIWDSGEEEPYVGGVISSPEVFVSGTVVIKCLRVLAGRCLVILSEFLPCILPEDGGMSS